MSGTVSKRKKGSIADLRREDTRRVTIRAKLYAAIVMTVLGPVITIAVAFAAFQSLSDRFDEVSARSDAPGARARAQVRGHRRQRLADRLRLRRRRAAGRSSSARRRTSGGCSPWPHRTAHRAARARDPRAPAHAPSTPSWRSTSSPIARCSAGQDAACQADLPRPRDPQLRGDGGRRGPARRRGAAPQRPRCERAFDQRLTDAKKSLVVVGLGAGRADRPAAAHRIGHRPARAGATGQP